MFEIPSGQPGLNMSHPLLGIAPRFSCVASGANVINVLNGSVGANVGTPAAAVNGLLGEVVDYTGATSRTTFPSPNALDTAFTYAGIFLFNSLAANQAVLTNTTGANGSEFILDSSFRMQINCRGVGQTTLAPVLSASAPYFVIMSINGASNASSIVVTDLRTGVRQSGTTTGLTATAPTGSLWTVGNRGGGTLPMNGRIACLAYSAGYLTPATLAAVSLDPWSYWYPA